jgi:hypothetical protein
MKKMRVQVAWVVFIWAVYVLMSIGMLMVEKI